MDMALTDREKAKRWRDRHPERARASARRYIERHPEKMKEIYRETARRKKEKDPEKYLADARERARRHRESHPLYHVRKFKISAVDYGKLFDAQGGLCAICGRPERAIGRGGNVRTLCVDHNHTTGKVRGLLCRDCNLAIGKIGDDPATMRRAVGYLEKGVAL